MTHATPVSEAPYTPPPHGFRTFVVVWTTQSVSVLGSALTFFAMTVWLTVSLYPNPQQKPQLAAALAFVGLAAAVPTVFLAPLAGAWADRHDRKRTMITMNIANGFLSMALATLVAMHHLHLWMLLLVFMLGDFFGGFHAASFDASYAMIVPDHQLPRANGMMQTMWSLSGIVTPTIAATLIALPALARQGLMPHAVSPLLSHMQNGTALAIGLDAITFFLSASVLPFLHIPSPIRHDLHARRTARWAWGTAILDLLLLRPSEPKAILVSVTLPAPDAQPTIWADMRQGASYIWQRRPMLWLLGTFTLANLTGSAFQILPPLMLRFNLHADWVAHHFTYESALALLTTIASVGGVAGGIVMSTWGGLRRRRVVGVLIPMAVSGVMEIFYGFSSWLYLTAALAFIANAMIPLLNAHSQAIWQSITPRALQGRVFSVRRLIAQCSLPVGTMLGGWLGGWLNPGWVIAFMGAILALFCIAQLFNRALLGIERLATEGVPLQASGRA